VVPRSLLRPRRCRINCATQINSKPHTGALPSVQLYVGLKVLFCCLLLYGPGASLKGKLVLSLNLYRIGNWLSGFLLRCAVWVMAMEPAARNLGSMVCVRSSN
jgi:hypothetical protein